MEKSLSKGRRVLRRSLFVLSVMMLTPILAIAQPSISKTVSQNPVYKTEVFEWIIEMDYGSPSFYRIEDQIPAGFILDLANSTIPAGGTVTYNPPNPQFRWISNGVMDGPVILKLRGHIDLNYIALQMTNTASVLSESLHPMVSDTAVVAVLTPQGTIQGKKFHDKNGNGIQEVGEEDLQGWIIFLDEDNDGFRDPGELWETTDAFGNYQFDNLLYGTYYVREEMQPGWEQTFPGIINDNMHVAALAVNSPLYVANFGNRLGGTIKVTKFGDANNSFAIDMGDERLAGWTIYIDEDNDGEFDPGEISGVTDVNGEVTFDLPAGNYIIREVNQDGWEQRLPLIGYFDVNLLPGMDAQVEFLNFTPSRITGYKWHDLNADGVWQGNEPPLAGWEIFVDLNKNGELDFGEPFDITDNDGYFELYPVNPGTWQVRESLQPTWHASYPELPYHEVMISFYGQEVSVNFGNYQYGRLSGVKFFDRNGNGIQNVDEQLLEGWEIYIDNNLNGQLDPGEPSTLTNEINGYAFDLVPGTYTLREVMQPEWVQTFPGNSGNHTVTVNSGEEISILDFGNRLIDGSDPFKPKDIVGNVWYDQVFQRRWDHPTENPMAGISITLNGVTEGGANVNRTTQADAKGVYRFDNLEFGEYFVTKTPDNTHFVEYPMLKKTTPTGTGHRILLSKGYNGIAKDDAVISAGDTPGWSMQYSNSGAGNIFMGMTLWLDLDDDGTADTELFASGNVAISWTPRAGQPGLSLIYSQMQLYGTHSTLGKFTVGLLGGNNRGTLQGSNTVSANMDMGALLYIEFEDKRWNAQENDRIVMTGEAFRWMPHGTLLLSGTSNVRMYDAFARFGARLVMSEAHFLYAADFGVNRSRFGHAPANLYPSLVENDGARVIEPFDPTGDPVFANTRFTGRYKVRTLANPNPPDLDPANGAPAVVFPAQVRGNSDITIPIATEGNGRLSVWVDLDRDGIWEPSELLVDRMNINPAEGRRTFFQFHLPAVSNGTLWVRMRLSPNDAVLDPHAIGFGGDIRDMPLNVINEGARLRGQVFNDKDANGLFSELDELLVGYQVYIDLDNNGERSDDEPLTITNASGHYEFTLSSGGNYQLRVLPNQQGMMISTPGPVSVADNEDKLFNIAVTILSVNDDEEKPTLPTEIELDQNYPNPFNPSTVVSFKLPETSNVKLSVHDVTGREVKVLVNGMRSGGTHQVIFDASGLSSGMYLYRLQIGAQVITRKMLLIK